MEFLCQENIYWSVKKKKSEFFLKKKKRQIFKNKMARFLRNICKWLGTYTSIWICIHSKQTMLKCFSCQKGVLNQNYVHIVLNHYLLNLIQMKFNPFLLWSSRSPSAAVKVLGRPGWTTSWRFTGSLYFVSGGTRAEPSPRGTFHPSYAGTVLPTFPLSRFHSR